MIPSITAVRMSGADRESLPLLVLGPSLGTSATVLWSQCAADLVGRFDVVAWDLPGHGHNRAVPEEDFTIAELAQGVLVVVDDILDHRGEHDGPFFVAGDSIGGGVACQLLLDAPGRVRAAAALCAAARFGTPEGWLDRGDQVQASGTRALTSALSRKWFAPGFLDRAPDVGPALLHDLQGADDAGYIALCRALADFDVTDRLGEISAPLLVVAGSDDQTSPPARELAEGVTGSRFVELEGVGHLAPAEAPARVAGLLREHFLGESPASDVEPADRRARDGRTVADVRAAGMEVRREVLGAAHVDRATANATDLTRDFQEFITEYAWGGIWTRPGLDRRSRSMITLTALVARGHHEELAMHLRAAVNNGVTLEEIKELLMQTAIYCGVPDANTAFRIAQQVFTEEG
ncbi:MAG: 4-carboxymuconolactone decarboxylase [Nocardioides sp.]|nr:4-carboxymuconolactone decarboxylase [Nocardioides sp.]